jgi:NADH dehydrogenase FAD-containing subunit
VICAGVLASPAARWLAMPTDKAGRVKVNPDLSIPGYSHIFAIGDTALVVAHSRNLIGLKNATAQPMPGLAQPAIQQGRYVANLIGRRVEGESSPEPFGIGIKATWPSSGARLPSPIYDFFVSQDSWAGSSGQACIFTS